MTIDPAKGLWLLPTRRRLEKLEKFLRSAKAAGFSTDITLLVQDAEYRELESRYEDICERYGLGCFRTASEGMAAKCQEYYAHLSGHYRPDWLGILSDDLICRTPGWDRTLISRLDGLNFVTPDDGWRAPARIGGGGIVFSGDLLRAVGYIAPTGMKHLYLDDVWETLGRDLGNWAFAPDVLLEHKHAALEAKPIDSTTAAINAFWADDEKAYRIWRYADREAASKRIVDLMVSKGVPRLDTDLTGIRLLITSPSPDPFFDGGFMDSVMNTVDLVKRCGGFADFYKLPGTSDIVYGRAVLFTSFLNSDFTHNLQVDSDMTFQPLDVVRMLKKNEPFLAAAGPRKSDEEMVFAFTCADDSGHTHPALLRGDGVAEVTEVGGAFVLVDRRFAERMTAAYRDLRFQDASGRIHYGLWLPTIENLRYRGEDYAMCRRWRAIGGKVLLDLAVALGHTGVKTWTGCAWEQVAREQRAIRTRQAEETALAAE